MKLDIKGKTYDLPIFLPDATHACLKSVDPVATAKTGIRGVVTNIFHLLTDVIVKVIKQSKGIKSFINFNGLVITDSGGFQAMSLIRNSPSNGKLTNDGVIFKNPKNGQVLYLTPESCIEAQIDVASDVVMVLDDCTNPNESTLEQEVSVKRTLAWAKRCKVKFNELTANLDQNQKPLIFGIVQGGNSKVLRKKCADGLKEIGFDGYAYGGWPIQSGKLLSKVLQYTANLMPDNRPKYAMGVGKPNDIVECTKMGYNMFDCVLPTRDARHGRLYTSDLSSSNNGSEKFKSELNPIDADCKCYTCQNFTKAYLRYLFKVKEQTFSTLATIHNIYTFEKLTKNMGEA